MCKRCFSILVISIIGLFCACSVMAQPVPDSKPVEIPAQSADHIHQIPAKDRKAIERDVVKQELQKLPNKTGKPISNPSDIHPKPVPNPPGNPKLIQSDDKIHLKKSIAQPLKDDEYRTLREHKNLKVEKKNLKPVKELTQLQKDCRIDREACRQDCKAAKKVCGNTKECAAGLSECKLDCKKRFLCH